MNEIKATWIPTWKSAHTSAWVLAFRKGFKEDTTLIANLRKIRYLGAMTEGETKNYIRAIANCIPSNIGYYIYCVLVKTSPNTTHAKAEFIKMIKDLSGADMFGVNNSYQGLYAVAVSETKNIVSVVKAINSAFAYYQAHVHSRTGLLRTISDMPSRETCVADGLCTFLKERNDYWSKFYSSRSQEMSSTLTVLKSLASDVKKEGFTGIGRTLKSNRNVLAPSASIVVEDDTETQIENYKRAMIEYSFFSMAYKFTIAKVSQDLDVFYDIPSDKFRALLIKSVDSYVSKRRSWGKNHVNAVSNWEEVKEKVLSCTRVSDMTRVVDEYIEPKVTWSSLRIKILEKLAITRRKITRMIRVIIMDDVTLENELISEEEDEVKKVDYVVPETLRNNPYAVLYCTDDSSSDATFYSAEDAVEHSDDSKVTSYVENVSIDDETLGEEADVVASLSNIEKTAVIVEEKSSHRNNESVDSSVAMLSKVIVADKSAEIVNLDTLSTATRKPDILSSSKSGFGSFGSAMKGGNVVSLSDFNLEKAIKAVDHTKFEESVYNAFVEVNSNVIDTAGRDKAKLLKLANKYIEHYMRAKLASSSVSAKFDAEPGGKIDIA